MAYPIRVSQKLWETPEITHINRQDMHSGLIPFESKDSALGRDRNESLWFKNLNGTWKFDLLKRPEEVSETALAIDCDDSGWDDITVPGNWTTQGFWDQPIYTNVQMPFDNTPPLVPEDNPTGVYRTTFELPKGWKDRRVVIHFGGVESYYELYVNDHFIGMAKDSRLPSEFDLTDALVEGKNVLAVKVIKWSDSSYIEDQDHWWMAGIYRDVYLYSTSREYLQDVHVNGDLDLETGDGILTVDVKLGFELGSWERNNGPREDYLITVDLLDAGGDSVFSTTDRASCNYRDTGYVSAFEADISRVKPWNHEQPYLYTTVVTLSTLDGTLIESRAVRTGFRNVCIVDQELLINGEAVLIKGVNRHEHHGTQGKTIPLETMVADIELLKQFNFNAVRTSHYPSDPKWYDLCDEHGILVMDEANIEAHANYATMCRDLRWATAFMERITRMVYRDRNHPCIFSWSLCNETGNGDNHRFAADAVREIDDTRVIHHEGELKEGWLQSGVNFEERDLDINDIIGPMYTHVDNVIQWAQNSSGTRPFILCEYSHAMGNSNGNLKEYWDAFESYHGLQGGFIWEWIDHGIKKTDENGVDYWAYGGDFGEEIHDTNFVCDGMIWPDRKPHPAMYEFKKIVQPVAVEEIDVLEGVIAVINKQYYTDLRWLSGWWELAVDGVQVQRGDLPKLTAGPGFEQLIELDLDPDCIVPGDECHLTVHFEVTEDQSWCKAGHEIAWEQFQLPILLDEVEETIVENDVSLDESDDTATVSCGSLSLSVDKANATVKGLSFDGEEVFSEMPTLNLWRACTDNDGIRAWSGQKNKPLGQWLEAGLDKLEIIDKSVDVQSTNFGVEVTTCTKYVPADKEKVITHEQTIAVQSDGSVLVSNTVDVPEGLPSLPRVGVIMQTVPGFERLQWFGPGPHESYVDRKEGTPVGRYSGTVDEQLVPYILPQECGNKVDTRWFTLESDDVCLKFIGEPLFEFSAHHVTPADLFASYHTNEVPRRDETVICLDTQQRGLGTGSCGPQTLPQYCVEPGTYMFDYTIKPYKK